MGPRLFKKRGDASGKPRSFLKRSGIPVSPIWLPSSHSARFCEQQVSAGGKFHVQVVDDLDKASNSEHFCIGQFDMTNCLWPVRKENEPGWRKVVIFRFLGGTRFRWYWHFSLCLAVICAGYAMYRVQMNAKEMEYIGYGKSFQDDLSSYKKRS